MSKRVVPNSPPAKRVGPSADSSSSLPRRITATTIDTNVQVPEEARDAEGSPLFPLYVMVRRRLAPVGRSDVTSKNSSDSSSLSPAQPLMTPLLEPNLAVEEASQLISLLEQLKGLEDRAQELLGRAICSSCAAAPAATVFVPCFHATLCAPCAASSTTCPCCSRAVTGRIPVKLPAPIHDFIIGNA